MKRALLALLFTVIASSGWAVCPTPLTVKDASGTTQNISTTDDASGNCQSNVVVANPGSEGMVVSTPTVQNASYVSGNCLGGFNAITVVPANGNSGFLQTVMVASKGGSVPVITIYEFSANPTGSTCTDKGTFTLAAADIGKLITAPFAVGLAAPTGTTVSFGQQSNIGSPFVAGGSSASGVQTIYYALVSGTTFTPGSTTDIVVVTGVSVRGTGP